MIELIKALITLLAIMGVGLILLIIGFLIAKLEDSDYE